MSSKASADGSTMATHNADCNDCDFRIGKVPGADWPEGSERNIVKFRAQYPRTISEIRGTTWTAENVDPWLPQKDIWLDPEWSESMVLVSIPQVSHTYAYIEGLYGLINEKQVGVGESTCGSRFFAGPVGDGCKKCTALLDISELSRLAMERASSAREAIQLMGDLAVEHGFYGSEWSDDIDPMIYLEAGEALSVTDPIEAWMFHITADDTATSAVWVAQRVPDGHVTVVANQFVIRNVDPDSDDFMVSPNLWDVAQRAELWSPEDGLLDFAAAFAVRPNDFPHYAYSTRRVWRVFDMVAPSLHLPPYVDTMGDQLPFSVPVDTPISVQDVMRIMRDHYEGTPFDLTQGLAAGPYGDVDRYDPAASKDGSMTQADAQKGYFDRSISLFRTSYSSVTQSRASLPDEVGAMVWIAQYKPSTSTYVPMYVGATDVPQPYRIGSLFTYTKSSTYWSFSAVGNWMAKARRYIYPDVVAAQLTLETPLLENQFDLEAHATSLVEAGDCEGAAALLTSVSDTAAQDALTTYQDMFELFISKYHDGYVMDHPNDDIVKNERLFYPKEWMDAVFFFQSLLEDEVATSIVLNEGVYDDLTKAEVALSKAQIRLGAAFDYAAAKYSSAKAAYFEAAAQAGLLPPAPSSSQTSEDNDDSRDGDSNTDSRAKMTKNNSVGVTDKVGEFDEALRQQVVGSLAAVAPQKDSGEDENVLLKSVNMSPVYVLLVAAATLVIGVVIGRSSIAKQGYTELAR